MASHCAEDDSSSGEMTALKLRLAEAEAELRRLRSQAREFAPAPPPLSPSAVPQSQLSSSSTTTSETEFDRRLEGALRSSENRMAAIFAQAAVGLSEISLEGRFLRVNAELCRMLQRTPEQLIGIPLAEVTYPEDLAATEAALQRLVEPGTQASIDKRYLRPDGSLLWANSIVTRLQEQPERPATFLAVTVDLTERLKAEQTLRASEERFRSIFEYAETGIAITECAGRIEQANPAFCRLLGYTESELREMDFPMLVHPEDRAQNLELVQKLMRGEVPSFVVENRYMAKSGGIVWVRKFVSVLHAEARTPTHFVVLVADITEQRAAEEQLRQRTARLQLLSEALGQLLTTPNPEAALRSLFSTVAAHLGTDTFLLYRFEENTGSLRLQAWSGGTEEEMAPFATLRLDQGLCGRVAQTRRPCYVEDLQRSAADSAQESFFHRGGYRAYAGHPLVSRQRLLGTISFARRQGPAFTEDEREFIGTMARYTSVALERSHTMRALAESEGRFRNMADNASVMVWVTEVDGTCSFISKSWLEFTGQTPQTALGEGWVEAIHPEDRSWAMQIFERASEEKIPFSIEYRLRAANGEYRWTIDAATPRRDEQGEFLGFVGSVIDITDRKQAEERVRESREYLALAIESASMGVWNWNLRDNSVEWSPECYEIFGRPDLAETVEALSGCIHPEDAEVFWSAIRTALDTRQPYEAEFRIIRDGGGTRWIANRGRARYGPDGRPERMLGVMLDITERKNAEAALARTKEALEHANRDLDRTVAERTAELRETITELESFSYTVSHDLKAPLRAMSCFSDLLLTEHMAELNDEGRDMLRRIAAAARRMEDLTNDLLNYTRISQGQLHVTNVQLEAILDHVMDLYPAWRDEADITVIHPLHAVRGHPTLVGQILTNLIGNAIKFVEPGVRPRVRIRTEVIDAAERPERHLPKHRHLMSQLHGGVRPGLRRAHSIMGTSDSSAAPVISYARPAVRIWVEDNGIGIDPQYHDKIFSIFQQLPGPEPHPGTGVGLAIVAKAVERMGGYCGVESALNQGSRFWVELDKAEPN